MILKKAVLKALLVGCLVFPVFSSYAWSDEEEDAEMAEFQQSLGEINYMDAGYRFKRDATVIFAACKTNWFPRYASARDCYRNGMQEMANNTPFDELIIKACDYIHENNWDAPNMVATNAMMACVDSVAKYTQYPKLKVVADHCKDFWFRRQLRDDCLKMGIRGIENGQMDRPRAQNGSMKINMDSGREDRGSVTYQDEIPSRSEFDTRQMASLIAACKAVNDAPTEWYYRDLPPNPYVADAQSLMTEEEKRKVASSVSEIQRRVKTNEGLNGEQESKLYEPFVRKDPSLPNVSPANSGKDLRIDQKLRGVLTSIAESGCYRDGLKAIGLGKTIPQVLRAACSGLLPIGGDLFTHCMRKGLLAVNLGEYHAAVAGCDADFMDDSIGLGTAWHFVTGLVSTNCYEDKLPGLHAGELKYRMQAAQKKASDHQQKSPGQNRVDDAAALASRGMVRGTAAASSAEK
jgi:hypothetical protein